MVQGNQCAAIKGVISCQVLTPFVLDTGPVDVMHVCFCF